MIKHTPGPWAVLEKRYLDTYRRVGGDYKFDTAHVFGRSKEETEANARLVAAAPCLLESFKQAVDQIEADYEFTPLDGRRALINKFKAVIAKAEIP